MEIQKLLKTRKKIRGNQIIKMLSLVTSLFFFSCFPESNVLEVNLISIDKKETDALRCTYKYCSTNINDVLFVERVFIDKQSREIIHTYYLSLRNDTLFIGEDIRDTVMFIPYALRNSSNTNTFDFNLFARADEYFSDSFGELSHVGNNKQLDIYEGKDYGDYHDGKIILHMREGYIVDLLQFDNVKLKEFSRSHYKERSKNIKHVCFYIHSP